MFHSHFGIYFLKGKTNEKLKKNKKAKEKCECVTNVHHHPPPTKLS